MELGKIELGKLSCNDPSLEKMIFIYNGIPKKSFICFRCMPYLKYIF